MTPDASRRLHNYNLGDREFNIHVWNVDLRGNRSLTMRHFSHQRRLPDESSQAVSDIHHRHGTRIEVRLHSLRPAFGAVA